MTHIDVVGGAYVEQCSYPRLEVNRGSGVRAACLLSSLGSEVTLHTAIDAASSGRFKIFSEKFGFIIDITNRKESIGFWYRHPLATPTIYPSSISSASYTKRVECENVVVFGMLESRPIVTADKVIYDPQDGINSVPFEANGSTAKELVIVASYSEGKALTGVVNPNDMAKKLFALGNIEAVIIKCGPQGLLVQTRNDSWWVKASPTKRVWKIGSGDVFTAAFSFAWLTDKKNILESACFASQMVAYYVETCSDKPNKSDVKTIWKDSERLLSDLGSASRPIPKEHIYLAGPFFSTGQRWLVDEARRALMDMGFNVFSPIHDVGVGPPNEVAPADIKAIEDSKLLLALMDGEDAGTLFEIGYARALNIPVVVIAESVHNHSLTMLLGSSCEVTVDFATGIYTACWHMMGDV